jgi:hypothetical protein
MTGYNMKQYDSILINLGMEQKTIDGLATQYPNTLNEIHAALKVLIAAGCDLSNDKKIPEKHAAIIEEIAKIIAPDWFSLLVDAEGKQYCVIENYPNQHLKFQQYAREKAHTIFALTEKYKATEEKDYCCGGVCKV